MTDDLDRAIHTLMSDMRELSPEAPPFPGTHRIQTERPPRARVPGWGIAVAAAFLVIMIVGLPLLIAGGGETPASSPDSTSVATTTAPVSTTTQLLVPSDAARSVQLRSTTIYVEDGHIDLLFPDAGTRGLGWILHRQVDSGDWDGVAWLVSSPLGSERTAQWYAIDEPPAIEDLGVTGDGPDTVVLPPELPLGRYRICDTAGWIPCAEFDLETRVPVVGNAQTTIQYPADGMVVIDPQITISGTVPVGATLSVGGSAVTSTAGGGTDSAGSPLAYFEASVTLEPGDNVIEVVVTDEEVSTTTLHVRYLPDATEQFAFLKRISTTDIDVDFAEWLTGEEANEAARLDGAISPGEEVPNDFYIRNTDRDLRTLSLAPDVSVVLVTAATGPVSQVPLGLEDWVSLFKADGTPWDPEVESVPVFPPPHFDFFGASSVYGPYWLTIHDGIVVQIRQQYIP